MARQKGDIKGPSWFTDYLKKEIGEDFDCWWVAKKVRRVVTPRGFVWAKGSWAVFQKIHVPQRGQGLLSSVSVLRPAWVDVMTLDGNFDTQTGLGRWVVHALKHCDITRRGNHRRLRELDELNEQNVRYEYEMRRKRKDEVVNDKVFKLIGKRIDDERGVAAMSGDERKAHARDEARRERMFHNEMDREARLARYYGTK